MRLLTKKVVCERIGFSPAHLDRFRFDEDYAHLSFPKPVRIGFKVLWSEEEVDAWINTQLASRERSP
ncbi:helix-turn-helix transcriptional regulator [Palleronia sp. KMU-117]|uniref:helix-turn-helix transcriptional regulator n=1 Tax=Palleronia sp. KMU-117 TaxID=3434108 RepID=UPI003D713698